MENTYLCPEITWTDIVEGDVNTLPEVNRVCFIKFSDGTTGISTLINTKVLDENEHPRQAWITRYRDDIVAWRYYTGGYPINGTYV